NRFRTNELDYITRTTDGFYKVNPQHMYRYGSNEYQSSPVVYLAHKQATANLNGDIESGGICRRHFYTVERFIGAVVDHIGHRWVEEERQEGSRQHQNDERVQCY